VLCIVVCDLNLILVVFWTLDLTIAIWFGTIICPMCLLKCQPTFVYSCRDLLLFRDNPDLCSDLFNMDDIACFIMGMCTG